VATSIVFTDATGAATLTNGKNGPGQRFTGWAPRPRLVGPAHHERGSGTRHAFEFRMDDDAAFSLDGIPAASMDTMLRLCKWLERGGTVTVNTGDLSSRQYLEVGLAEGAEVPYPEMTDRGSIEYRMDFVLSSRAATPVPMICIYK
jgi:hypothetical protein